MCGVRAENSVSVSHHRTESMTETRRLTDSTRARTNNRVLSSNEITGEISGRAFEGLYSVQVL